MKLSIIIASTVSAGSSRATRQLDNIADQAVDFINSDAFYRRTPGNKGTSFRNRWSDKFRNNAKSLKRNLDRSCGNKQADFTATTIEFKDYCNDLPKLMDEFQAWTNAHLGDCRQATIRQEKKNERHLEKLHKVMDCSTHSTFDDDSTSDDSSTDDSSSDNLWYQCPNESPEGLFHCHTLGHDVDAGMQSIQDMYIDQGEDEDYRQDYFDSFEPYRLGATVKVSNVCNPNWASTHWPDLYNCAVVEEKQYLCGFKNELLYIRYGTLTENGFETWLNCPQCGCTGDNNAKKWADVHNNI